MTWVRGKHQIVFGGEWVQNQLNICNAYETNGIFTFNGEYSGSGPNGGSTIGDQNLDFLMGTLGIVSPFQQSKKQQNALRGPIPSLYVQDTYHANHAADAGRRPALWARISCRSITSIAALSSTWPTFLPTRSARSIPTLPPERSTTATRA